MLDGVTITANPAEMARLQHNLTLLQQQTGRDAKDAVVYAGIRIMKAAGVRSKPGAKKRDVIPNQKWNGQRRRTFTEAQLAHIRESYKTGKARHRGGTTQLKYLIVDRNQGRAPQYIQTSSQRPKATMPRRLIAAYDVPRRGLARESWKWLMQGISAPITGKAARHVEANTGALRSQNPTLILTNRLTYVEKAYPGITQQSVVSANNFLAKAIELKLRRRLAAMQ